MIDWSQCPEVERNPAKVSGAWLFKGTRVPVKALFATWTVPTKLWIAPATPAVLLFAKMLPTMVVVPWKLYNTPAELPVPVWLLPAKVLSMMVTLPCALVMTPPLPELLLDTTLSTTFSAPFSW